MPHGAELTVQHVPTLTTQAPLGDGLRYWVVVRLSPRFTEVLKARIGRATRLSAVLVILEGDALVITRAGVPLVPQPLGLDVLSLPINRGQGNNGGVHFAPPLQHGSAQRRGETMEM